jgi:hypothetical protein
VTVNWTPESLENISRMEERLGRCKEDEYPDRELSHVDSMEGFVTVAFVSESDGAASGFRHPSAIAWTFFMSGAYYVYRVDSIPVVRMHIRKNNAVVGHVPGCLETGWVCQ